MRREQVNLSTLAQDITEDLKMADPDRQVEFVIAEGVTVSGDPTLIRVALENLIGNAWKFHAEKRKRQEVNWGMMTQGKKHVYYVRDNGAGFDMKYADKLFAPFQRLHSATEYTGTELVLLQFNGLFVAMEAISGLKVLSIREQLFILHWNNKGRELSPCMKRRLC